MCTNDGCSAAARALSALPFKLPLRIGLNSDAQKESRRALLKVLTSLRSAQNGYDISATDMSDFKGALRAAGFPGVWLDESCTDGVGAANSCNIAGGFVRECLGFMGMRDRGSLFHSHINGQDFASIDISPSGDHSFAEIVKEVLAGVQADNFPEILVCVRDMAGEQGSIATVPNTMDLHFPGRTDVLRYSLFSGVEIAEDPQKLSRHVAVVSDRDAGFKASSGTAPVSDVTGISTDWRVAIFVFDTVVVDKAAEPSDFAGINAEEPNAKPLPYVDPSEKPLPSSDSSRHLPNRKQAQEKADERTRTAKENMKHFTNTLSKLPTHTLRNLWKRRATYMRHSKKQKEKLRLEDASINYNDKTDLTSYQQFRMREMLTDTYRKHLAAVSALVDKHTALFDWFSDVIVCTQRPQCPSYLGFHVFSKRVNLSTDRMKDFQVAASGLKVRGPDVNDDVSNGERSGISAGNARPTIDFALTLSLEGTSKPILITGSHDISMCKAVANTMLLILEPKATFQRQTQNAFSKLVFFLSSALREAFSNSRTLVENDSRTLVENDGGHNGAAPIQNSSGVPDSTYWENEPTWTACTTARRWCLPTQQAMTDGGEHASGADRQEKCFVHALSYMIFLLSSRFDVSPFERLALMQCTMRHGFGDCNMTKKDLTYMAANVFGVYEHVSSWSTDMLKSSGRSDRDTLLTEQKSVAQHLESVRLKKDTGSETTLSDILGITRWRKYKLMAQQGPSADNAQGSDKSVLQSSYTGPGRKKKEKPPTKCTDATGPTRLRMPSRVFQTGRARPCPSAHVCPLLPCSLVGRVVKQCVRRGGGTPMKFMTISPEGLNSESHLSTLHFHP